MDLAHSPKLLYIRNRIFSIWGSLKKGHMYPLKTRRDKVIYIYEYEQYRGSFKKGQDRNRRQSLFAWTKKILI